MPIVEVSNLAKKYPRPDKKNEFFYAVDGVSLSINKGQIYGILGPNGAGKTTTLEMIEGLTDIDSGQALVDGLDVATQPYQVKKNIGVQLQANEYFDHLSLRELLALFSHLYGRNDDPEELLGKVNLKEKANAKPANLSGGQKQRFSPLPAPWSMTPRCFFWMNPPPAWILRPSAISGTWYVSSMITV